MTSISAYSGSSTRATTPGTAPSERTGRLHRAGPQKPEEIPAASGDDTGSTSVSILSDSSDAQDLMPPASSTLDLASTTASSSNQGPDILAALLEKVLKQYGGGSSDAPSQPGATSSISTTA